MASSPSPADTMGMLSPLSCNSVQATMEEAMKALFQDDDSNKEESSDKKESKKSSNPMDSFNNDFMKQSDGLSGGGDAAAGVDASELAEVAMVL
ncbi:Uncharacterised protein [Legionella busanensis]|uniref:Uncharacterized protein n=1 Tax=Legionella busanensis TaxID=190655 RepID=A0A378JQ69_9GAMM|nr:hypothetical protein [Legionella busanensis]STX52828.1 Uncharacterised protein [Legionella busanensis]